MGVGFAGLGRISSRMAANLARAGHEVTLWNRSADKAIDVAADIGARVAETPRALAERAEIVLTILADDAALDAVHLGPDRMFAASGGARWMLEMGTMSPHHVAALRDAAPDGVSVIDARSPAQRRARKRRS
jgi:3-hydroxyisobutyrate dehydrogenase-like beta-hydroxyacid dehydrogenase